MNYRGLQILRILRLTMGLQQECFSEIIHVITYLYRFSITIRNPAQRDRLQKCASINVSRYECFDIQHAFNQFPKAEEYLISRLEKANPTLHIGNY